MALEYVNVERMGAGECWRGGAGKRGSKGGIERQGNK